ncbi:BppU family phage baseplate upper protein [Staphylococcus xylosus]|uniref:BppU family phage baseplate upper protein n=1 Tax=Staphylococcus xylosus TaxID=1288 RepID=UPI001C3E9DF2|nr:BppU family phage baseplate upper protein [Staphylococcus xylosus]
MSQLNKEVLINLENTAQYQPRSNLNVSFSTADRDSAVFIFNVTKDNEPYLLGPENVKGHIALKHSDKSFIKDTLTFKDPLLNTKGQFEYQMPNELLKRQGSVTMQVLIAEKGLSNVIVAERIVSFNIEQSLVSEISAETKLQYIVELDELYDRIEDRMTLFEQQMASGEDIITRINEAKEKGLSDIDIAGSNFINEIKKIGNEKTGEITTLGENYIKQLDGDKTTILQLINDFKVYINEIDVVTKKETEQWQKYKLTDDTGKLLYAALNNHESQLHNLKPGKYYATLVPGLNNASANAGFLTVEHRGNTVKRMTFRPYNSEEIFVKRYYNDWTPWYKLNEDFETVVNVENKVNTAESNANRYTDDKLNEQMTLLFESRVKGVGSIINLPESLDNFILLYIFIDFPGGEVPCIANPLGSKSIVLNNTNVVDNSDGGGNYEIIIQKLSRTQLKIINDVFWDFGNHRGSGKNANQHTITKIVGVRNYANIS